MYICTYDYLSFSGQVSQRKIFWSSLQKLGKQNIKKRREGQRKYYKERDKGFTKGGKIHRERENFTKGKRRREEKCAVFKLGNFSKRDPYSGHLGGIFPWVRRKIFPAPKQIFNPGGGNFQAPKLLWSFSGQMGARTLVIETLLSRKLAMSTCLVLSDLGRDWSVGWGFVSPKA